MANKKEINNPNDTIQCVGKCRRILKKNNFYKSNRDEYINLGGYCNICKSCLRELTLESNNQVNIEGIKMVLSHLNKPFLWDLFYKVNADKLFDMGIYLRQLNTSQYKNMTFKDSDKEEDINIGQDDINKTDTYETNSENETDFKLTKEVINFWGKGFSTEDYEFLENEFTKLINCYECEGYAMELLFQEASQQRLTIKKKREKGESVDKELKTLQDLLGSANIKPVQETGANATDQETFGTLIKKYENEKPIPEPLPEWKDVDGIKKYISVWFLGHLCKMLGVKNEYSYMYEEEVRKYNVETPTFDDEEIDEDDIEKFENIDVDRIDDEEGK